MVGDERHEDAGGTETGGEKAARGLETFAYNDAIARAFLMITVLWGVVALLVGLIVALQLAWPALNLGFPLLPSGV